MLGSSRQCHSVTILDDDSCEVAPEDFFAELAYVSGYRVNQIIVPTTRIVINVSDEPECGK